MPKHEVKLGINSSAIASTLPIVADSRHLWSKSGVDVKVSGFAAGKLALEALENGSVDIATVAETPATLEALRGHPIVVFATISISPYDVVVRKDHGIKTVADLTGRKAGTFVGSAAEFVLDETLARNHVDRSSVTVTHLAPPELVSALVRGDLDAISVWQPFSRMATDALGDRAISFASDPYYLERFNIVSTPTFVTERRSDVLKVLRALIAAEEVVSKDPGEAQAVVAHSTGINGQTVAATWPRFQLHVGLDANLPAVMSAVAAWAKSKDESLRGKSFEPDRIIDTSLLESLDKARVQLISK